MRFEKVATTDFVIYFAFNFDRELNKRFFHGPLARRSLLKKCFVGLQTTASKFVIDEEARWPFFWLALAKVFHLRGDSDIKHVSIKSLLRQQLIQQLFAFPLLLQIVRGPLLHQRLQVVSILLDLSQQHIQTRWSLTVPRPKYSTSIVEKCTHTQLPYIPFNFIVQFKWKGVQNTLIWTTVIKLSNAQIPQNELTAGVFCLWCLNTV